MNAGALLVEVRFVEGRYHGRNDWPPSPFRLFQALVAGAYGGRWVSEPENEKDAAFSWLESLDPPHIAAPPREKGASASYFVPNNDLDAVGGDPLRVSEIRVRKAVSTSLFNHRTPVLYAWRFARGGISVGNLGWRQWMAFQEFVEAHQVVRIWQNWLSRRDRQSVVRRRL